MNIDKYYILVTEGVTDCSFLEAVLNKYLGFTQYEYVKDLPLLFQEMIGTYPTTSGGLKRQDSPSFYYKDNIGIAIKQANGYNNIPQRISMLINVIDKLEVYDQFGGFLIFCDTDLKNHEETKEIFKRAFEEEGILLKDGYLYVYDKKLGCESYLFPAMGVGAIEKLLLDCASISYAKLFQTAFEYRNNFVKDEYQSLRNECWASDKRVQEFYFDKVQFGAISAVLKPDRPVRFTIMDKIIRSCFFEKYMQIPEFEKLHNFLKSKLV